MVWLLKLIALYVIFVHYGIAMITCRSCLVSGAGRVESRDIRQESWEKLGRTVGISLFFFPFFLYANFVMYSCMMQCMNLYLVVFTLLF